VTSIAVARLIAPRPRPEKPVTAPRLLTPGVAVGSGVFVDVTVGFGVFVGMLAPAESLARLYQAQGDREAAQHILASTADWFSERVEMADL